MLRYYVCSIVLMALNVNAWGQTESASDPMTLYAQGKSMMWGTDGGKKDVKTGYKYLMEAADKGTVNFYKEKAKEGDAQMELIYGLCFIEGNGVVESPAQAYQLIKNAYSHGELAAGRIVERLANAGSPAFQYVLGFFYYDGECGFEKSVTLARSYWIDAANSGHHYSIVLLANDSFSKEDWGEAYKWNLKVSEIGTLKEQSVANFNLGYMHKNGYGAACDPLKAIEYYTLSGEQGESNAYYNLAKLLSFIGRSKDALAAYEKGAEMGQLSCLNELGNYYHEGYTPVSKDYSKAVYYYQKAADDGSATAMFNLALCYINGQGVAKNISKGKSLLQQSAKKGNSGAQKILNNWDDYEF